MKRIEEVEQALNVGAYIYIRIHGNDVYEVICERTRAGEWITDHQKCTGAKLEKTLRKCAKQSLKSHAKRKAKTKDKFSGMQAQKIKGKKK